MSRPATRHLAIIMTAAIVAAVLFFLALPPPARVVVVPDPAPRDERSAIVRGAFHVHSDRSDGSGSVTNIAEAARRAGLDFVILTDHGDGTRPPRAPAYHRGVLCVDAVEISTDGGGSWEPARLQEPVLPKAHTRFRHLWRWEGAEAEIMSRAVDETGYVQPRREALRAERGRRARGYHLNPITGWTVHADGRMFYRTEPPW